MKQSGRTSIIPIAAVSGLVILIGILMFSKESLESIGGRFMTALATGDVDKLTALSYVGDEKPDEIKKQWEFATKTAGAHYAFFWRITSADQQSESSGAVRMQIKRNADQPGSYDEAFQLPMTKVNGEWKVDVKGISRQMYPALPR